MRRNCLRRGSLIPRRILRVKLRLPQSRQIFGDAVFGIESKNLGIGADESFIENAPGQRVEAFLFDGLQHARADFGDVGNVIQRKAAPVALFAKFLSECSHPRTPAAGQEPAAQTDGIIIGQPPHACHSFV